MIRFLKTIGRGWTREKGISREVKPVRGSFEWEEDEVRQVRLAG